HEGKSVTKRQSQPNAHSVNVSPDNRFAFVADLGLDKVLIYKLDPAKGTLTPNDPPFAAVAPGSGPRHFAFHPSGKFAYLPRAARSRCVRPPSRPAGWAEPPRCHRRSWRRARPCRSCPP
ncbi:MAG: hypothetical protein EB141_20990, partial [Verrucomicrobia bacterium]|nr:hypothetical protein [Verrucomicrobiota bacterium]